MRHNFLVRKYTAVQNFENDLTDLCGNGGYTLHSWHVIPSGHKRAWPDEIIAVYESCEVEAGA